VGNALFFQQFGKQEGEIDGLLALEDEEAANAAPPLPAAEVL